MFGHDPDWTHHTSEDTVDKTDASELLRVGVMATAASEWMGSDSSEDTLFHLEEREMLYCLQRHPAGVPEKQFGGKNGVPQTKLGCPALEPSMFAKEDRFKSKTTGPHRLALLPINSKDLFADLAGDDKQWWDAQRERFADPHGDLLPEGPTMEKLVWETINFMDGHRSTAELADLLSAEYLVDVNQAWVDRLVKILEAKKLVARK
jgi:hypothetical protein